MTTSKELIPMEENENRVSEFTALCMSPEEAAERFEIIKDNLAGERLTSRDLDRITVPAGGSINWEIPEEGDYTYSKEMVGVIVDITSPRAYYGRTLEETGRTPPDCFSPDGVTGHTALQFVAEPGQPAPSGDCFNCPLSQFGSSPDGASTACKEYRNLFVLLPNSVLPTVVQAPVTSVTNVRNYLKTLSGFRGSSQGRNYKAVKTRFTLEKVETGPFPYSRVALSVVDDLSDTEKVAVRHYLQLIQDGPVQFKDDPARILAPVSDAGYEEVTVEGAASFETLPDED